MAESLRGCAFTPAVRAALHDPVVAWARRYEIAMVLFLTYLMLAKPF
jgi:hypothetical protein